MGCKIYPTIKSIVQSKKVALIEMIVKFLTNYSLPSPIALPDLKLYKISYFFGKIYLVFTYERIYCGLDSFSKH